MLRSVLPDRQRACVLGVDLQSQQLSPTAMLITELVGVFLENVSGNDFPFCSAVTFAVLFCLLEEHGDILIFVLQVWRKIIFQSNLALARCTNFTRKFINTC